MFIGMLQPTVSGHYTWRMILLVIYMPCTLCSIQPFNVACLNTAQKCNGCLSLNKDMCSTCTLLHFHTCKGTRIKDKTRTVSDSLLCMTMSVTTTTTQPPLTAVTLLSTSSTATALPQQQQPTTTTTTTATTTATRTLQAEATASTTEHQPWPSPSSPSTTSGRQESKPILPKPITDVTVKKQVSL